MSITTKAPTAAAMRAADRLPYPGESAAMEQSWRDVCAAIIDAETGLAELRRAAIAFLNTAPLEGDYRLCLLSMTGGTAESLDKIGQMGDEYAAALKAFRDLLARVEGQKP